MENSKPVRVRFAPSPTGSLHVGGVRTALYNYLFAKKHNGTIVLRSEDTDRERFVAGAEQYIVDSLKWCGITFDEGVDPNKPNDMYRQSVRAAAGVYDEHIRGLLHEGKAYYAFDTDEDLKRLRASAVGNNVVSYNHATRLRMSNSLSMDAATLTEKLKTTPYVVRLKVEPGETVRFYDLIRGDVSFSTDTLDDKVLIKSDGIPTYHFANVVDDYLMGISHVIRGEEWLPSTPHHVLLYKALGWDYPTFAHLPLLLKPSGKGKLSKRDGAVFGFPVVPTTWNNGEYPGFREAGYLPEVLMNFLAILSWSPGNNEEIMTMERMIEVFDLSKVSKAGARFVIDKLNNWNKLALSEMPDENLLELLRPFVKGYGDDFLLPIIAAYKSRVEKLSDFTEKAGYLFADDYPVDPVMLGKWNPDAEDVIKGILVFYNALTPFEWKEAKLYEIANTLCEDKGMKIGKVLPSLRLALTGSQFGAGVFTIAELIGKDATTDRLRRALLTY